jgi:hypothetical protein
LSEEGISIPVSKEVHSIEAIQQKKPEKKIRESSRMVIHLIDGSTEQCTVNQWVESIKNSYTIRKNDREILIQHHAVVKIMFERK